MTRDILGRMLVFFAVVVAIAVPAAADRRVALVVGNSSYQHYPVLPNPLEDARQVAQVLRSADFEVIEAIDQGRLELETTVRRYLGALEGADSSLFYYSGHAVQVDGVNYLIPIDAKLDGAFDLDFEAFSLNNIQNYMQARSKTRLIFLDACRDNPFKSKSFATGAGVTRSVASGGLARVSAGVGTLIAFSTEPDDVALDGASGGMSPFTAAFVKNALKPAREIRQLLTDVRNEVVASTNGRQVPWENSSLLGDFFFVPPKAPPVVEAMARVDVATGAGASPLALRAPLQPEGGAIRITIEEPPKVGALIAAGKPVTAGATLSPQDFEQLAFDPAGAADGALELVRYRVDDDWGNSLQAIVAIGVKSGATPVVAAGAADDDAAAGALLARLAGKPIVVPIGVGPVALGLTPPADAGSFRLKVAALPPAGELRLGARLLGAGETVAASELGSLTYTPHALGSAKQVEIALQAAAGANARSVPLTLALEITDCDRLAGEPLDLQGVGAGVFSNAIDVEPALRACLADVAAHPDVPRFFYQLGRVELARRNTKQGAELIQAAAAQGHIRALQSLGVLYLRGAFGATDFPKAIESFEGAAAKGDAFAMHSLGKRLFYGEGVDQDRKRGLALMLQASEMGHTYAMNELGAIFKRGDGVKQDAERAVGFFEISAARSDIYGYDNLGLAYLDGAGVKQDYQKALELFLQAHEGGHPTAATNIGRMHYNGWGVEASAAGAALWYGLSADRGDAYGANNLGYIALNGEAGPADPVAAARSYALSVALERGDASGEASLQLTKIGEDDQRQAIQALMGELGLPLPKQVGVVDGSVRKATLTALTEYGIAEPKGTTAVLVALARLKWLRSRPRFDVF